MITTLHIKNIGIIDDLNVELGKGLNVFTGETGAFVEDVSLKT